MEEESDARATFAGRESEVERPEEAQWPIWSGYIQRAFDQLRDDRFYGAMGGLSRIYYQAKSRYAADHAIVGSAFGDFLIYLGAVDDEFVAITTERQKAEQDKHKT
jgi:hypothetical protein